MNNKPTVAISADFLTAYAALPRQKQGKVTEFFNKFRNDPMHPGINFEKINEGIDKNICSVRIDDTYRGIVVREPKSNVYILLWVDHHDEAYAWAKRKKCSINKLTGSVQIFDVQEVIEEQNTIDEPALFANISDEVFEKIGLPEEQFPMIKAIKTLEGLHSLKAAIPEDAFEGLEWLGNGFTAEEVLDTLYPEIEHVEVKENDFAAALQTDASKKSFVIVEGEEELQAIMQEPLEKWRIFLHPTQRKIVDKKFNGPARVLGGAGTGKTVVAMHRAKMLASNLESNGKILFTTYTKNLAEDIKDNLRKICSAEEMKRIDIINLDAWVSNFLRRQGYEYQIVYDEEVDKASIIVDEGQDLSPSAYRLLRALAGDEHQNDIFIVGDSHQRIYRNKAVLSKCGINVRGRSSYLRINYRTTEEIRKFAFSLLNGVSFDDLDEDYDNGKGCQSLTHGDKPEIKEFATPEEELDYLVSRIHELETAGVEQKNICIVARTHV